MKSFHEGNTLKRDHEAAVEKSQAWLKENTKRYAFKKLEREIIQTGACVECGSCVAGCPVDAITGERVESKYVPTLTGKCIACGTCYAMCPRTSILEKDIIGEYSSVWKVRSLGNHRRQDGGAVTTILGMMLERKMIEAAIVASHYDENLWLPAAKKVTSKEELLASGGTFYTHAQVIEQMMNCFKENLSNVAVVGTACNIDAVHRLQSHPAGIFNIDPEPPTAFKVSLFCMESFDYQGLGSFLKKEGIDIKKVDRFAIAKGEFMVTVDGETKNWPIKDLDNIASSSCAYCTDLTGMNSDLSCGNIGSDEGWTTVIARSKKGEQALELAIKEGVVEAEKLDENALQAVINTARSKMNKRFKLKAAH